MLTKNLIKENRGNYVEIFTKDYRGKKPNYFGILNGFDGDTLLLNSNEFLRYENIAKINIMLIN